MAVAPDQRMPQMSIPGIGAAARMPGIVGREITAPA